MNKIFLSAVVGLSTLAFVEGAETQTQPATGTPAPDFSLTTSDGSQVSLKDYRGKWVVLYFYPKDFTSGCTMEAKNFQRDLAKYEQASAVVLGVSVDTAQSHKDFCAKEGLNFKLLADPDGKVSMPRCSMLFRRMGMRIVRSFAIRSSRCSKTKPLELPESFGRTAGAAPAALAAEACCSCLLSPVNKSVPLAGEW